MGHKGVSKGPLPSHMLSHQRVRHRPPSEVLDEERFEKFKQGQYYPANIGDVLISKYQIVGKLGFGSTSTVWLARDLEDLLYHNPNNRFTEDLFKSGLMQIFLALDYLHTECKLVYTVEIWNVVVMVWDLFEGRHLFHGNDPDGKGYSTWTHLAEVMGILGPPPLDMLQRGKRSHEFFASDGKWKQDIEIPTGVSLDQLEEFLEGRNKEIIIASMRAMLQWRPEDRKTVSPGPSTLRLYPEWFDIHANTINFLIRKSEITYSVLLRQGSQVTSGVFQDYGCMIPYIPTYVPDFLCQILAFPFRFRDQPLAGFAH
ncbi:unnamed protein product [Penicillium egyptiacum]|uniref:non-specific serine/threonine protein kinase n=1 Tax=Penicillium egyptiacum TaxID=1303716 RepID=A0A9W4K757_9EURO|nr:unnamed protein product [Penicillium egyptiacum]